MSWPPPWEIPTLTKVGPKKKEVAELQRCPEPTWGWTGAGAALGVALGACWLGPTPRRQREWQRVCKGDVPGRDSSCSEGPAPPG